MGITALQGHNGIIRVVLHKAEHKVDGLRLVALNADDDLFDAQMLLDGRNTAHHALGAFQKFPVVRGNVRLAFRAVDDEGVDGRKILGRELDRRGETRAAQAHQAARLHRRNERSVVRHLGRNTGRVRRLLAVGPDDDSRYRTAVGHMHGLHGLHGAGHAAVDGCADETARRAHNGTHQHRIALFHRGGARRADMLLHGQHDLFGQGHGDSGHTGCFLFMRHARAEGAAFEFG